MKCRGEQIGTPLGDRLAELAESGDWNLQKISAESLASRFLPAVLPSTWRGREEVAWQASNLPPHLLERLWGLLRGLPDLAPLEAWPLVPVKGSRLVRALPSSQVTTSSFPS